MKTTIFKLGIVLLLVGNLTVSCNSCNKDNGTSVPAYSATDSNEIDTTNVADVQNTAETGSETSTAKTVRKTVKNKATSPDGSGYSAPDGTDAENNDGDQYT